MLCAGIDEAGRGPLAGPVTAAAVVLDDDIPGLADSKKLSAARREALYVEITARARAWCVARATPAEVDAHNIHRATLLAMARAVQGLGLLPQLCIVDGLHLPALPCPGRAEVGADALHPVVSAASILAKVARDREMRQWDLIYPAYGFARHKGYPTAAHRAALQAHGPSAIHRYSYAPVAQHSLSLAR